MGSNRILSTTRMVQNGSPPIANNGKQTRHHHQTSKGKNFVQAFVPISNAVGAFDGTGQSNGKDIGNRGREAILQDNIGVGLFPLVK